jgi:acetyl-CoA acetyltransferase
LTSRTARRVAIVGAGTSPHGRDLGLSNGALTALAAKAALQDAGLDRDAIDGVAVYTKVDGPQRSNQFLSPQSVVGMLGLPAPAWVSCTMDGAAYLSAAIHAVDAVASGSCDVCLTVRTLVHPGSAFATDRPLSEYGGTEQFKAPFGALASVHWAALIWQRHMAQYGSTADQLGYQAVAQRKFAAQNDEAVFREPLSIEDYLASRWISRPLRLYDCEYPVSYSGAIIYTTEERARDLKEKPVFVESCSLGVCPGPDFYITPDLIRTAPFIAAERMWARSDYKPSDLSIGGLYDGFTVITMMWLEALGLCDIGGSGQFVQAGNTAPGGAFPVNTDGGALNVGRSHGVGHAIEVVRQLRRSCGSRQVADAEVGVVTSSIGPVAACMLLTSE